MSSLEIFLFYSFCLVDYQIELNALWYYNVEFDLKQLPVCLFEIEI